ncbi:MAG: hypothetical protein J6X32_05495 [Salinivirgaceae bacterium]|nr:hypothetical protein [Salinivirgaceae bacterium]MBR2195308.1 hypothetical protein [Salinivirgaceae bacterium]
MVIYVIFEAIICIVGIILIIAYLIYTFNPPAPSGETSIRVKLEDGTERTVTIELKEIAEARKKAKKLFPPKNITINVKLEDGTPKSIVFDTEELAKTIEKVEKENNYVSYHELFG